MSPRPWNTTVRVIRPRPNQALQRTGSVPEFTVLPRFQLRCGFGRPLNFPSLGILLSSRSIWHTARIF